jgi:hypothetical protein
LDLALPLRREALERSTRVFGRQHRRTLKARAALGVLLSEMGETAEAGPMLADALAGLVSWSNMACVHGPWQVALHSRAHQDARDVQRHSDINAAIAAIDIARARLEINTNEKLKEEETARVQLDTLGSMEGAMKSEGSNCKRRKKR